MTAATTNIIAKNAEYFIADLNNGGVRIGMFDVCAFDFPASHAEYAKVKALDLADAEELFDAYYVKYVPLPTDGYAHMN